MQHFLKSTLIVSTALISAVKADTDADYNYLQLAEDWVDRPDSYCGSTEQSPIDLNGDYMPLTASNFVPKIYLPTISSVSIQNSGLNIDLDFEIDDSRLEVYSPKDESFTHLYGDYTGTGISDSSSRRSLRGSTSPLGEKTNDTILTNISLLESEIETEASEGILGDIHFHVPSEHAVNGRLAAAEIHLVHYVVRPDDDSCDFEYNGEKACIVVVGILFDLVHNEVPTTTGNETQDLLTFLGAIPGYGDDSTTVDGSFDLNTMLPPNSNDMWTYRGSLTTPECNENVTWMVVQEPRPIRWSEWSELRNAIVHEELGDLNARPPQPRNNRVVYESFFEREEEEQVDEEAGQEPVRNSIPPFRD